MCIVREAILSRPIGGMSILGSMAAYGCRQRWDRDVCRAEETGPFDPPTADDADDDDADDIHEEDTALRVFRET
jgi:hypothetical protein